MSEQGSIQPGTRIDEDVWEAFRNEVDRKCGGVRGHLRSELERALREYVDGSNGGDTNDRLRRLENAVEAIDERTAALVDETGKKKKDSDVSKTTKNRLDKIGDVIEREAGKGPVHEAVVRQAIEDVAGHSEPTIRRYTQMLTEREVVYPHPTRDSKYVFGEKEFVEMVQSLGHAGALGNDDYWELVDGFGGEDAFADALERYDVDTNDGDDHTPGFQ